MSRLPLFALLLFAVAVFAKRPPFLEFTEEDGSKCTIVKTGKVLSSTDCALEGTDDTLSGRVSTLRTAVDNLSQRMTNAETELEGLKQPPSPAPTPAPASMKLVGQGHCRYAWNGNNPNPGKVFSKCNVDHFGSYSRCKDWPASNIRCLDDLDNQFPNTISATSRNCPADKICEDYCASNPYCLAVEVQYHWSSGGSHAQSDRSMNCVLTLLADSAEEIDASTQNYPMMKEAGKKCGIYTGSFGAAQAPVTPTYTDSYPGIRACYAKDS